MTQPSAANIADFPDMKYHDLYLRRVFSLVVIFVTGFVSLWYLATFVYRAPFPGEQLSQLTSASPNELIPDVPVSFILHIPSNSENLSRQLMSSLQGNAYKSPRSQLSLNVKPVFYLHPMNSTELENIIAVNSTSEVITFPELKDGVSDKNLEYHLVVIQKDTVEVKPTVHLDEHSARPVFYIICPLSTATEDIEKLLKNTVNKVLSFLVKESSEGMAVDYSPSYQLTFTVMYETPPSVVPHALGAGLPQLISEQFSPFLTSLSPLSNFEVASQTQFYSGLAFKPKKMAGYEGLPPWHAIEQRRLPHFINSAEWDLASAVSNSPDLNLIIYVPSPHLTPLHIVDTKGRQITSNAFAIPQWGGVVIVNPSQGQISTQDIKQALSVHLLHLQELLGLVQAPFDPPQTGLRLSLDRLFLQKTSSLMLATTKTLSALQALIITITQMEVGDIIVAYTKASLNTLLAASNALALGNLIDALQSSRLAFQNAEAGFFHPTMVSQMYFPTDASYALFLPLLLPAILPLALGIFKQKKRSKAINALN